MQLAFLNSTRFQSSGLMSHNTLFAILLFSCAAAANAHSGEGNVGGFIAGFMHPISWFDHLLAMVAVGIWGATLGRPLLWALPVAFPLLMVVGGVLGITGVPMPYLASGIAVSVVVLGPAIAVAWRAPVAVALPIVAAFGVFMAKPMSQSYPPLQRPPLMRLALFLARVCYL